MWGNLNIGKKLGFSFGLVVLAAVLLGLVSWSKVDGIDAGRHAFESVTLKKRDTLTEGANGL